MAFLDLNTDIKPWLGIDPSNTDFDYVLNIINEAMEQAIINYTETDFQLHTEVNEVHDANQSDVLIPRNIPVVSIQAVYFYTLADGSEGSLREAIEYQLREDIIVFQNQQLPFKRSRVRVDYTWGYDGLPDDVKLCMLQAVEAEFRRKSNKTLGVKSRSKKDESHSLSNNPSDWDTKSGLPKELVYKLTPYKVFEFPNQPMAARNV